MTHNSRVIVSMHHSLMTMTHALPALLRFVSVGTSTSKDRVVYFMFSL